MEATIERDAATTKIDKAISGLDAEIRGVLGKMRRINARLLPPAPTCKEDLSEGGEQGWLGETLLSLANIHVLANSVRSEVNVLSAAVEANQVKGEEVKT